MAPTLKLDELFVKAVELDDSDQRQVYLDAACEGDQGLRAELEALLEAHFAAGDFMEVPAAASDAGDDFARNAGPGTAVGRYKLLKQIGEGGMGLVFMAEQMEPIRRPVAVKIIKAGMDSRRVLARFEAERQVLAVMEHPNIAKVLDVGTTDDGRPYFVMELVRGQAITDYCENHQLSVPERLNLFVRVCRALQHAHQKGVIHRDIKPSNVLVTVHDGEPVPKVIDFGVAKATEQQLIECSQYTEQGQLIGTLEYMSPEQAELLQPDVDTRSDVYSLGVVLYELLTGVTPLRREDLKAMGLSQMLAAIREEEPPRPSANVLHLAEAAGAAPRQRIAEAKRLARLLKRDLDWIVLKALAKSRARRYQSASDLADDVERFLRGEAVTARRPSIPYRLSKWGVRRRGSLTTCAVAVAAAVAAAYMSYTPPSDLIIRSANQIVSGGENRGMMAARDGAVITVEGVLNNEGGVIDAGDTAQWIHYHDAHVIGGRLAGMVHWIDGCVILEDVSRDEVWLEIQPRGELLFRGANRRTFAHFADRIGEGFEPSRAQWAYCWDFNCSGVGQISCTDRYEPNASRRHLTMEASLPGFVPSLNEAVAHLDVKGDKDVTLQFWHKEFDDDDDPMPPQFEGSGNYDGVAFSVDGMVWHRLISLTGRSSTNSYRRHSFNVTRAAAAAGFRLKPRDGLRIKFQQYGEYPIRTAEGDGFAFDAIEVLQ